MAQQLTQINLKVKRPEDMARVVDQIHTLAARMNAGSSVTITIIGPVTPPDTTKDENDLL